MTIAEDVVMIAQIRHRNDGIGRTTMQIFHRKPRYVRDQSDGGCGPLVGGLVLIVLLYIIAQAVQYFNQGPTP